MHQIHMQALTIFDILFLTYDCVQSIITSFLSVYTGRLASTISSSISDYRIISSRYVFVADAESFKRAVWGKIFI